jgi:hypothetical protein
MAHVAYGIVGVIGRSKPHTKVSWDGKQMPVGAMVNLLFSSRLALWPGSLWPFSQILLFSHSSREPLGLLKGLILSDIFNYIMLWQQLCS